MGQDKPLVPGKPTKQYVVQGDTSVKSVLPFDSLPLQNKTLITDYSSYYDYAIDENKMFYRQKGTDNWLDISHNARGRQIISEFVASQPKGPVYDPIPLKAPEPQIEPKILPIATPPLSPPVVKVVPKIEPTPVVMATKVEPVAAKTEPVVVKTEPVKAPLENKTNIQMPTKMPAKMKPVKTENKPVNTGAFDSAGMIQQLGYQPDSTQQELLKSFTGSVQYKDRHMTSPNYGDPATRDTTMKMKPARMILHHTGGDLQSTIATFQNGKSTNPVSAHVVIDKDGTRYNFNNDNDIMWHSGDSESKDVYSLNYDALGIEIVGDSDKGDITDHQINSAAEYIIGKMIKYKINPSDVISHKMARKSLAGKTKINSDGTEVKIQGKPDLNEKVYKRILDKVSSYYAEHKLDYKTAPTAAEIQTDLMYSEASRKEKRAKTLPPLAPPDQDADLQQKRLKGPNVKQ